MENFNIFVPLTKIDTAKRLVYGVATAEKVDTVGEICDYASTKPYYEKWSGDIQKASGGRSLGNLRAMHGKVAAGKVTDIVFNDDAKQIEICAKVVDDDEWKKVEEGVYTGFSQGGRYAKRWKDEDGLKRYTAAPVEVSLVDAPCLPEATFEVVKADGAIEMRKFATVAQEPTNEDVSAKAVELAKAAGDETKWADHLEAARAELLKNAAAAPMAALAPAEGEQGKQPDPEVTKSIPVNPTDGEEWEQVWKSKRDGTTYKTKAELRAHHEALDAEKVAANATGPANEKLDQIEAALGIEKRAFTTEERKKAAASGAAMSDGSFPIENKEDLENAVRAFGRAKNKASAKRHIIRRAKALDATDLLPADWPGSTKDKAKKADGTTDLEKLDTPELQKAATLWSVSNLVSLMASLDGAEEQLEGDSPFTYYDGTTRVSIDKEVTDRFGTLLVEFGDIVADVLDTILTSIRKEEAEEAMELAKPIADLMKAGARHSKSDIEILQGAHDALTKLGAECTTEKSDNSEDMAKVAGELAETKDSLAKVTGERDALQKNFDSMSERLDKVLDRMTKSGIGAPRLRVVDKTDDQTAGAKDDEVAKAVAAILSDPDKAADLAIRIAQANGKPLISR